MEEQAQPIGDSKTEVTNTPPLMAQQNGEFIKWQLENSDMVEKLEWRLKGKAYNSETDEYIQICKPMMNDTGVYWTITAVETFTDKIFQLSNFTQDEINEMVESFEHDMVDHLFAHAKEYGLNITADLRLIHSMVSSTVLASVKRGLGAGTYRGMSMGFQHTEVSQTNPQRRGGWMSRFLPRTI